MVDGMEKSEARSSLDALLDRVQVMRVGFQDGDPMFFDLVQEGSLKRLSMALDIDLAAHADELRRARAEALRDAAEHILPPYNAELLPDGREDPESAIHVAAIGEIYDLLQRRADRIERGNDA